LSALPGELQSVTHEFTEILTRVEFEKFCPGYTSPEQSSSGVLALTLSCGRPAIATDFQYARAILDGHNGMVVPSGNLNALISAIESLALNDGERARMAEASYNSTRSWVWPEVAQRHLKILGEMSIQPLDASTSLR
jgi:glycosyltransferase involved in cell wall biosynthesis